MKRIPLLLILLFAVQVGAATYYLDAVNGNDSNDGQSTQEAWKTLAKAQATVSAGDTINLATGNYGIFLQENFTYNDWVTYQASNGATPVFDQLSLKQTIKQDGYLRFDGITVRIPVTWWFDNAVGWQSVIDFRKGRVTSSGGKVFESLLRHEDKEPEVVGDWQTYWVEITDANDAVPDPNIYPRQITGPVILIDETDHVDLLNLTVKGFHKYLTTTALGIFDISDNILIEDCNISQCERLIGASGDNITIRGNHLHELTGSAIRYETGSGLIIERNHIHDGGYDSLADWGPVLVLHHYTDANGEDPPVQPPVDYIVEETITEINDANIYGIIGSLDWNFEYIEVNEIILERWLYDASIVKFTPSGWGAGVTYIGLTSGATAEVNAIDTDDFPHGSAVALRGSARDINSVIRNNIIYDGFPTGSIWTYTAGFSNITLENNLIYNTSRVYLSLVLQPIIVRNNTTIGLVDNEGLTDSSIIRRYKDGMLTVTVGGGEDGTGFAIYNNLVLSRWGFDVSPPVNFIENYNFLWGWVDHAVGDGANTEFAVWIDSATLHGRPNIYEDIGYTGTTDEYNYSTDGIIDFFVDFANDDYHLAATSYGINFGDADNQPSDSLGTIVDGFIQDDGVARDASHHSMGAYEYREEDIDGGLRKFSIGLKTGNKQIKSGGK